MAPVEPPLFIPWIYLQLQQRVISNDLQVQKRFRGQGIQQPVHIVDIRRDPTIDRNDDVADSHASLIRGTVRQNLYDLDGLLRQQIQ